MKVNINQYTVSQNNAYLSIRLRKLRIILLKSRAFMLISIMALQKAALRFLKKILL